ncbi:mitochondrial mRNA pseudouridine synthase RPUSD3 [Pelobates fuscus]|uniref:mitochondrial mRNA pseudouridine synthase RPUSD3 n=1 Tax=Pelobates fuscus TaxID=191477 RepID=UPI002FE44751
MRKMDVVCQQLVLSKSLLTLCDSGYRMATRSLSSVRARNTLPCNQTRLDIKNGDKKPRFTPQDSKVSILRNPGVFNVTNQTREKLCELVAQNVVYSKGPLVAVNKPQGLSISGIPEEVSLSSLLPELQQHLGIRSELHVVKAAPKESSGLVLLSSCHTTSKHIEEFYAKCRKSQTPVVTFCAVTMGIPSPLEGEVNVALTIEQVGEHKLVVPITHPTKGSLERREVKNTETHYKVLDSADSCALVQLQPMSVFQSQLLVHMTWKLCKVLGDHTYSARVGKVLGEPIYVPIDIAVPQTQVLEEKILRKMHFTQQQMHRMPLHLHLHQLLIPNHDEQKGSMLLTAPPPPFFLRTIKLLGLTMKEPLLSNQNPLALPKTEKTVAPKNF